MAQQHPQVGYNVIGTIKDAKGNCPWSHRPGDSFEISAYDTAGLCGFFYHDIFPYLVMLQFGGSYPPEWTSDADTVELECMTRTTAVKIELRRVRE